MRLYDRGIKALNANKLDRAHHFFEDSLEADQRNVHAWMGLGVVRSNRGDTAGAAGAFHRATRLAPNRYEPHFNLGTVFERAGLHSQAIGAYEQALELAPDQVEVMENLARCYLKSNQKLQEAELLIQKSLVIEDRPEWVAWLQRQRIRLESGKRDAVVSE